MFLKDTTRRLRKRIRIRKKIHGTPECPRLSVFKSLKHIYAQLIDDTTGTTLAAASTLSKEIAEELKGVKGKVEKGRIVGKLLAKIATEKGITAAVFDRNGYPYHGKVKAVAEGAREGGLKF
ncbi:50S ribosomal protein L18 [Melioribacter sp. OK-6-Me]|uniref:50S ribosomal protein L18 n=1 Tax=unclassified Melioribacter TaxID=2627329 RepID=UPI003ED88D7F